MKNIEDLLYPLLSIYNKTPQLFKDVVGGLYSLLPYTIIYGKNYMQFLDLINSAKSFTKDEILDYQWREIEKVLDVAFSTIPFYQSLYAAYGIKRNHIHNFSDFIKLPIINKQIIKDNVESMLSSKYPNEKLKMNTGGSTGSPLAFYIHKGINRPKEKAFVNSYYDSIGYNRKKRSVTFRGDKVPGNKIYMYDPIRNSYIFSSYRVTKENIERIVSNLNNIKPVFIFGYPSVVYDVSKLIKEHSNIRIRSFLKGIILSSEKLFDFQIMLIEEVFNTKVYSLYGHSERLVIGYKCSGCNNYIMDPLYGYAELVDNDSLKIVDTDKKGKIVATGFHNLVMPFIRYDTDDESKYAHNFCENCQQSSSVIFGDIEGR